MSGDSSIATTRAKLRERRARKLARCSSRCAGWDVFESDRYGTEIEACGECNGYALARLRVTDDDVRILPEARRKLAREIAPLTLAQHDVITQLLVASAWLDRAYPTSARGDADATHANLRAAHAAIDAAIALVERK